MSVTLVNQRSEIERLSQLVEAFGASHNLPSQLIFFLNLALDEVVTNIIRHAYEGGRHEIAVRVTLEGDVLAAEVADDGRAFNPLLAPPADVNAVLEDRPIGGLGVHIVRSVMDSLKYRREGEKNVLVMKKAIKRDESRPAD